VEDLVVSPGPYNVADNGGNAGGGGGEFGIGMGPPNGLIPALWEGGG